MYWRTLPNIFWIIFYLFLFITLLTGIYSILSKKLKSLSIVAIILAITIPIQGLISSIGRGEGVNEFEFLINQLNECSLWAIYVSLGFIYLLIWWILFFIKVIKYKK